MRSWNELERILRMIRDDVSCPSCHSKYSKDDVHIVGQVGEAMFLNMKCSVCGSSAFLNVVTPSKKQGELNGKKPDQEQGNSESKIPENYDKTVEGSIGTNHSSRISDFLNSNT
jgi:hypothetical protein